MEEEVARVPGHQSAPDSISVSMMTGKDDTPENIIRAELTMKAEKPRAKSVHSPACYFPTPYHFTPTSLDMMKEDARVRTEKLMEDAVRVTAALAASYEDGEEAAGGTSTEEREVLPVAEVTVQKTPTEDRNPSLAASSDQNMLTLPEVAAQGLAALRAIERKGISSTGVPQNQGQGTTSSSTTASPSPSQLRSPLGRALVGVPPPPGGYWFPNAKPGQPNKPMCPPCKTSKKGQCIGGMPCERCISRGYGRERCEGSLVWRR